MTIGTGIAIAGIWIGVAIACFATPFAAFGFIGAMVATFAACS